jgi:hypothetical protein
MKKNAIQSKKRFRVGAKVRVLNPGVCGVVKETSDEPESLGEYWHTIETESGEMKEPGCNLELIPRQQG